MIFKYPLVGFLSLLIVTIILTLINKVSLTGFKTTKDNIITSIKATSIYTERNTVFQHEHDKFYYFTLFHDGDKQELILFAKSNGLQYHGLVGELQTYHLFSKPKKQARFMKREESWKFNEFHINGDLKSDSLKSFKPLELQTLRRRLKRAAIGKARPQNKGTLNMTRFELLGIRDPGFPRQWHFHNQEVVGNDLNVTGLWEEGFTGKGVTVAIVDDGIDYEHRDIKENFYAEGSYDFNDLRPLPMPMLPEDTHGTRCAGQIAGLRNDACGVGIAYEAKVSGIRVLSKDISDDAEAAAINFKYQTNQIYSCSWGPPDDGQAMDRPPKIVEAAIENGVIKGRGGLGSIFVFASGNGGYKGDNCNFDGYTNSIYSITVGSIDRENQHPTYSEACTALMITAYSSGNAGPRIYTSSSWNNQCTDSHGGTSAAAPMVAGIIALALQKRPDLTWRDFQHISVQSAIPVNLEDPSWSKTHANRWYSPKFGYGKIDGYKFVHHALNFKTKNKQTRLATPILRVDQIIPNSGAPLISKVTIDQTTLDNVKFKSLEHVAVTVHITHPRRSNIRIELVSPNGIISEICTPRVKDNSSEGFPNWTFMTVKHWDEPVVGTWQINVYDEKDPQAIGRFIEWQILFYGDSTVPFIKDSSSIPPSSKQEVVEPSKISENEADKTITQEIKPAPVKPTENENTNKEKETFKKVNVPTTSSKEESNDEINTVTILVTSESIKTSSASLPEPTDFSIVNNTTATNILQQYHPSFLTTGFIVFCILIILIVSITLFYRWRQRSFYQLNQREMALLENEQQFDLQSLDSEENEDGGYHDDDNDGIGSSELVYSGEGPVPTTIPNQDVPVTQLLFDGEDLLLSDDDDDDLVKSRN